MTERQSNVESTALKPETVALEDGLHDVYRLLARLYLEPPAAPHLEALERWCTAIGEAEALPTDLEEAVETVADAEADPETLKPAFTRVFLAVDQRRSPPPPYESLYVDGVLNGPSSTELEACYTDAGYELAVDDDLIDHAGYELDFLAELSEWGDRRRQLAFLETHVGEWLPSFHDRAREAEPPAFYRGVFELTEAILEVHASALEEAGVSIDE